MPTPVTTIRIPEPLMARIQAEFARRKQLCEINGTLAEWTMSEFLVKCITDKLDHIERSRKSRPKKVPLGEELVELTGLPPIPEPVEPTDRDLAQLLAAAFPHPL